MMQLLLHAFYTWRNKLRETENLPVKVDYWDSKSHLTDTNALVPFYCCPPTSRSRLAHFPRASILLEDFMEKQIM